MAVALLVAVLAGMDRLGLFGPNGDDFARYHNRTFTVARVVDGVLRRLQEEPAPPRHARIDGSPERWAELLATVTAADAR